MIRKVALLCFAATAVACASDPNAVYARVDRVIVQPETIQIWGIFAIAKENHGNEYLPPARGYLYFKLAGNKEAALKEWADLKEIAGSGQIVSFGSRYDPLPGLRTSDARPENPDLYSTNIGLTKVRGKTDWPPVRALLDYKN